MESGGGGAWLSDMCCVSVRTGGGAASGLGPGMCCVSTSGTAASPACGSVFLALAWTLSTGGSVFLTLARPSAGGLVFLFLASAGGAVFSLGLATGSSDGGFVLGLALPGDTASLALTWA